MKPKLIPARAALAACLLLGGVSPAASELALPVAIERDPDKRRRPQTCEDDACQAT